MRLRYFRGETSEPNFGDLLNELIFPKLLPDCFDDDPEVEFIGIGSILGVMLREGAKFNKAVVFSTGYAAGKEDTYGAVPKLDERCDIICVRGPLTAKAIGVSEDLAVTDGAMLLRSMDLALPSEKKYRVSYMPHMSTVAIFDWRHLCDDCGIHFIDPVTRDTRRVLEEIKASELLLAEAMHGAIVADTLRVPWVPVVSNRTINDFKWRDWTSSLNLEYRPTRLETLFEGTALRDAIGCRVPVMGGLASRAYGAYQKLLIEPRVRKRFSELEHGARYLSEERVLDEKVDQLLGKLEEFKRRYRVPATEA